MIISDDDVNRSRFIKYYVPNTFIFDMTLNH